MKCEKTNGHERHHYRTKLALGLLVSLGLAGFASSTAGWAADGIRVEVPSTPAPFQSQTPMAAFEGNVFVAWTDSQSQGPPRVRLARLVPE